jgi:hypothetical protein
MACGAAAIISREVPTLMLSRCCRRVCAHYRQMCAERDRYYRRMCAHDRRCYRAEPFSLSSRYSYTEPSLDPLERLSKLREVFFQGDQSLGQRTLPLTRQSTDPQYAKFRENVRWTYGNVLFVTLHIVGSNNNLGYTPENDAEYAERHAANVVWLKQAFELAKRNAHKGLMILTQANPYFEDHWREGRQQSLHIVPPNPKPTGYGDFLKALEADVLAFDKPVAFVQGDTHYFRIDQPLFSTTKQRVIEHFTRVEVFGSPNVHWVRGIVDLNDPQVFTFKPEIVQKNLVNHSAQ